MSSTYQYVTYKIEGLVKIYGVPVAFEMTGYSLPSGETEILPDSKIEDDPLAYQKIRQPRQESYEKIVMLALNTHDNADLRHNSFVAKIL